MRRVLVILAVVALLIIGVEAYEVPTDFSAGTLEAYVEEFMQAYGLDETNFSISYYNTVTGESYAFNDTWFSISGSCYKLPLNMVFYEMQMAGEITGDTLINGTGRTLDEIHEQSLLNSNNELSEALMYYWGSHTAYKENLRRYFTMTDEEIDPLYWQGNWFCTRMMMDCLQYLYANQEQFQEAIGYLKQAMPDQYFKRSVTEYEVAHKYGSVQWFNNDIGIIYTPQPYLLAVFTQGGGVGSDGVCAEAARLMTAYNLWQAEQTLPEEEPVELPEEIQEEAPEEIVSEEIPETSATDPEETAVWEYEDPRPGRETRIVLWIVLAAAVALAAVGIIREERKTRI